MNLRRKMLTGGGVMLGGQIAGQGLGFVRNIVIARMISPHDFGIAATFAVTLSLLEMMSDLAADKLLIQARDGQDPKLQSVAHALQALRGAVSAALIFLLAWPIARLFGVPEAAWAFQLLALVPLTRGLMHLDSRRMQRELRYRPFVTVEVAAQSAALAAAWPLAHWLNDYSAVLWVTLLQTAVAVAVSHAVAERAYRWAWEPATVRRMLDFGWPLMVNGLLMFGIFQGDRVIIGANYAMEALAVYSVAFSLTMVPTLMLARVNAALVLPALASCQDQPEELRRRYRHAVHWLGLSGAMLAAGFILVGGLLVVLLYGGRYAGAGAFIGWLGAMQAVRLMRAAPSQLAMALGETRNTMLANFVRSLALAGMLAAALLHAPLGWIAACGLAGEVMALLAAVALLRRQHGVAARLTFAPLALPGLLILLAGAAAGLGIGRHPALAALALLALVVLAAVVISLLPRSMPRLDLALPPGAACGDKA